MTKPPWICHCIILYGTWGQGEGEGTEYIINKGGDRTETEVEGIRDAQDGDKEFQEIRKW